MTRSAETDKTFPAGIAARLRREILTGELPPGSALKERDNAQRLGVSRTPLREAVRIPLQNPPAPRPRPRSLSHWLCTALWTPTSWALLKLADWVRPGGKR